MAIQKGRLRFCVRHGRARRTSLILWTAMVLAGCSASFSAPPEHSVPNRPQGPVRVQLFDVYSGLVLANAAVEVISDDGVVCERDSCSNGQSWSGQSDDSGMLVIPSSAIQFDTYVKTKDHQAVRLAGDVIKGLSRANQIELYPEWLYDEQHEWTRGYKLVDARSGQVLANSPVRIEFPKHDWPARHGGIPSLDAKTNPLGYVFFSFLRKPEQKQGQTLPSVSEADWVTPVAWATVSGYHRAKLGYLDGSAGSERSEIRLRQ